MTTLYPSVHCARLTNNTGFQPSHVCGWLDAPRIPHVYTDCMLGHPGQTPTHHACIIIWMNTPYNFVVSLTDPISQVFFLILLAIRGPRQTKWGVPPPSAAMVSVIKSGGGGAPLPPSKYGPVIQHSVQCSSQFYTLICVS
jgi:hypothetical protein